MKHDLWSRASRFGERTLSGEQTDLLDGYRQWLLDEAIPAGGMGLEERQRLDDRHIGDALLFGAFLPQNPAEIWDLGSGVGLPGIPLAIQLPESHVVLFDRSGKRVDLMKRAVRVLDLGNVTVREMDIRHLRGATTNIVSRAALPPSDLAAVTRRYLRPSGVAVVGGSWTTRPRYEGWEVAEIPAWVLDHTVWLLIMRRQ